MSFASRQSASASVFDVLPVARAERITGFFHPVVWWVSGWVRLEREHCCDRLVVARTGRARPYAELLAALAVPGISPGRAAVAMAESPVVARIRLILNPEDHSMRVSRPVVALAAALLLAPAVLIASQAALAGRDEDPKPKPAAPPMPAKLDPAKVDDLFRRARHGADMFQDVQGRVYALIQLASARARLGDRDAARQTFREAIALGETVSIDDSHYMPHILQWVARWQARYGFRDEAAQTLRTLLRIAEAPVQRDGRRSDLYSNIMKTQIEVGDRAGAQETLRLARQFYMTSKDPGISTFAPMSLVRIQTMSGDLAGALKMVDDPELFKGPNPENVKDLRHGALFSIVREIDPSRREGADAVLEAARRAVEEYQDDIPWRGRTTRNQDLGHIAEALARLERLDEARKTAGAIDEANLPGNLAESANARFLDEQRFNKALTFAAIAEAQLKAENPGGARQSARDAINLVAATRDPSYKWSPLQRAILVLAKAGEPVEALRHADTIHPNMRVETYVAVSEARRRAGDAAGARETLQAALKIVREQIATAKAIDPEGPSSAYAERNRLLGEEAHLQVLLGDVKGALETVRGINDMGQQIEAMKRLAMDRATADDLDGALEVIGQINAPKSAAEALEGVASALARRNAEPEH